MHAQQVDLKQCPALKPTVCPSASKMRHNHCVLLHACLRRRHVPELALHLQPRTNAFIPWGNSNKRQLHEKVIWDLLFPGTVLRWLRQMGYKW